MKPHTVLIPLFASLAFLAPSAGLAELSITHTHTENRNSTPYNIPQTGDSAVQSFELAQTQTQNPDASYHMTLHSLGWRSL